MTQVKRADSLGTLSDQTTFARLTDARVTVGGRQYVIASLDSAAYAGLTNGQTYQVYVTAVSATPALVIAQTAPVTAFRLIGELFIAADGSRSLSIAKEFTGHEFSGEIGEEIAVSTGTVGYTNGQYVDLTNFTLTPGTWILYGGASHGSNGSGTNIRYNVGWSDLSGNNIGINGEGSQVGLSYSTIKGPPVVGVDSNEVTAPTRVVTVSADTVIYAKGGVFNATGGTLRADNSRFRAVRIG